MMKKHTTAYYLNLLQQQDLVEDFDLRGSEDKKIRHLSYDSQDMEYNTLFICKGIHFKEEYLFDAEKKGAVCYISEKRFEGTSLGYILVKDIKRTANADRKSVV